MHGSHQRQRAVTLVELTVSITVTTVLLVGLTSAMVLASRAIPDRQSPLAAVTDGYYVTEQIAGELFCAQSFTGRSPTVVEFTVADRDNDASPEMIRYEWSGTPGDSLMRQYNGGTSAVVSEDIHEFALGYRFTSQTETTTQEATTWTEEALLASFDGWLGVTPITRNHAVTATKWESEYFEIIPPDGATELKITLAKLRMYRGSTAPGSLTAAIHRSKGDGSYEPDSTPIGTVATIPGAGLSTSPLWIDVTFSDVTVSDPARTDYCLVVKGVGSIPAYVQYYYSKSAPDNGMYQRWTEDGGGSWEPRANLLIQQDVRFELYGTFATTEIQEVTVDRYFLTSMSIALSVGPDSSTHVETSVQILNSPEVASP